MNVVPWRNLQTSGRCDLNAHEATSTFPVHPSATGNPLVRTADRGAHVPPRTQDPVFQLSQWETWGMQKRGAQAAAASFVGNM